MNKAVREARRLGHRAILLVGDAPYYGRFGFTADATGALRLPGPYEPERLLGLALKPGALDGARGLVRATGHRLPRACRTSSPARTTRRSPPDCTVGDDTMNALTRVTESHLLHATFAGPIVMIGFGSIGRGLLPLLERHIGFDRSKFVVIAPDDSDRALLDARKLRFEKLAITRENYRDVLTPLLTGGPGRGMIINLSVDTSSADLMDLCKDIDAFYIDTVCEPWPGLYTDKTPFDLAALQLRAARGRARRAPPPPRRRDRGELLRRQSRHGVLDGEAGAARRRDRAEARLRRADLARGLGAADGSAWA